MTETTNGATSIRFLFDPNCPWTWRTSQWMREIQGQESLNVEWELYTLEWANRANPDNPYLPMLRRTRPAIRLLELVRRQRGAHTVSRLYAALGTARHVHDADLGDVDVLRKAASDVGIDQSLVEQALNDESLDAELETQYKALDEYKVIGVPTLFIGDAAPVYGPVIDPVPSGDDARQLWRDVSALSQRPFFYELKRSR